MTTEIIPGTKAVAQRIVNAGNSFVAMVVEQFSTTPAQAEKVLRVFRKAKAVKLDAVNGRYILTHGAYWEAEVIDRAINTAE